LLVDDATGSNDRCLPPPNPVVLSVDGGILKKERCGVVVGGDYTGSLVRVTGASAMGDDGAKGGHLDPENKKLDGGWPGNGQGGGGGGN